jgi:hypothetical protein
MSELSKEARRAIRDAASVAYERELSDALFSLAETFEEWKSGSRNAFDVSDAIHEFHQGEARELFNRYGSGSVPDLAVAGAVARGIMTLNEIPPSGRDHIAGIVQAIRGAEP